MFIPVWGTYWDDAMELCRQPMGKVCWHDLLSTLTGSAEDGAILASPAPMDWARSVAVCRDPMSSDPPRMFGRSVAAMSQRSYLSVASLWTLCGNLIFAIEYFVSTLWAAVRTWLG